MSLTRGERFRYKLKSFSNKNFICKIIAAPLRFVLFLGNAIKANSKKLGLAFSTLLFFPFFTSFSFGIGSEQKLVDLVIDFGVLDDSVTVGEVDRESANDLAMIADENVTDEDKQYEISVSESGELSDDDLYLTNDIIDDLYNSFYTDENGEVKTPSKEDKDYSDYQFDPDEWSLILINKSHFIPEDYEFELGTISGWFQVDKRMLPDLSAMLKDSMDAGIPLTIASPYRSSDTQVMLYDAKITKYMNAGMSYLEAYKLAGQAVTIPGASEHEAGLCLDILGSGYRGLDFGFANTTAGKWLEANAHKYGFVLRYPKDKEYITTIEFEPWHFRYVGVEAATVMYNENLCLEEFWEKYLE